MADEASDTVGGGVRNYLGAIGFIVALIGAEILREGGSQWLGISLLAAGLPIFLAPTAWKFVSSRLRPKPLAASEPTLKYLSARDSELGSAIMSMARRSAWGRWFAAQHLVSTGSRIDEMYLFKVAGTCRHAN